jgi:6-phosphogluconolactonase (cycloisomerase 2 family)
LTTALAACGGGGGDSAASSGNSGGSTPAPAAANFTIGGTASGVTGSGLVLQNNGKDNLTVAAGATTFTFATAIASGAAYNVTVATQPSTPTQTCTVTNATGTASANVTNVAVSCTTAAPANVTVGGTVSGLAGAGLVLQNNHGDNLTIAAGATSFTFATAIGPAAAYAVTVSTQPGGPNQLCRVGSTGSGNAAGANVTNVAIVCATIGQFAYTANNGSGTLTSWSINPTTGALTQTSNPPISVVTAGSAFPTAPAAVSLAPNGKWAFSATDNGTRIWAFTMDPMTGVLTQNGAPVSVPFTNGHPYPDIAVDPSNHFLYLASEGDGQVAGFTIDQTSGQLTLIPGSPFAAGAGAGAIPAFSPDGHFVYVMNQTGNTVSAYAITPVTGVLTKVGTTDAPTGTTPTWIVFTPNGKFAYVSNSGSGNISEYSVNADGSLTATVTIGAGDGAADLTVDATGTHLYCPNKATGGTGSTISVYSIDQATGLLTQVGANVPTGAAPFLVTIDATGRFAYTASSGGADVHGFTIDQTTGGLTPMAQVFATGMVPNFLIIDPSGQFAYTANQQTSDISAFAIDQNTGALAPVGTYPTGGNHPFVVSISPEAPGIRD